MNVGDRLLGSALPDQQGPCHACGSIRVLLHGICEECAVTAIRRRAER